MVAGAHELAGLGERYAKRFPSLFKPEWDLAPYPSTTMLVRSTQVTVESLATRTCSDFHVLTSGRVFRIGCLSVGCAIAQRKVVTTLFS